MRAFCLLAVAGLLLAGCADEPPATTGEETSLDPPVAQPPEFDVIDGAILVSTPAPCIILIGETAADGVVEFNAPIDDRSKGQPFEAYINVTDGVNVGVGLEFTFPGSNPAQTYHSGVPGQPIRGTVPVTDQPVSLYVQACGAGTDVTVHYRALLAPDAAAD